ncbi:MAG: hypothetical protein RL630_855 [Verrucomicrobiota bacterium]|jgi:cell division protein FtsN
MNPDDAIRKFFEEMKRQDAAYAPLFHHCLPHETQASLPRPASRALLFAMAVAVLVLAAGALFFQVLHKGPALAENTFEQWAALSDWEPSSDQLVAQQLPLHADEISAPTDTFFENPTTTATPHPNL